MNIDFANLKLAYLAHQEVFEKEISRVLSDASYIMGPEIEKLERFKSIYWRQTQHFMFIRNRRSIACHDGFKHKSWR